jgi:oligopeptide transport system permease protein
MSLAMLGICLPTFVMGPILATIFGLKLGWFNVAGFTEWSDLILPGTTIGLFYAAYFARLARAGMLESLSQDYIRTAKAKGLPGWRIVVFHSLRGGLMPLISFLGPAMAGLVVGSFVVESVFRIPGLGQHFTEAAMNKDYSLVLGTTAFYCALLVVANLAVDVLQVLLNPRLRFSAS